MNKNTGKKYDVRCEGRIILPSVKLEIALKFIEEIQTLENITPDSKQVYSITTVKRTKNESDV